MKHNHGLTFIELLISLSLLAVVLVAGINLFLIPNKAFDKIIIQSSLEDDVNEVLREIGIDIRSATKPAPETNAIIVYNSDGDTDTSGNRIDIYDYKDNKYYKVSYKYSDGFLYKGSIEKDTSDSIKTASIDNYSEILSGIIYPSEGELFQDITIEPEEHNRRTISINLIAEDETGNFFTSHERPLIFTSRTKSSP